MPSKSPDAFRTISEVADWLNTPAHVLRFWESKFSQVKPVKRAGGRRYYRPADMTLLGGIKKLLHDDGMTIKGVQKILREQGIKHVSALSPPLDEDLEAMIEPVPAAPPTPAPAPAPVETGQVLDFAGRSAAAARPQAGDGPPSETAAPSGPVTPLRAETPQAEELPGFVQSSLSERQAEAEGAATPPAPPPTSDNLPPAEPDPTAETEAAPETTPLAQALPDPAPEASEPSPQDLPEPDEDPAPAGADDWFEPAADPGPLAVTGAEPEPEEDAADPEPDPAILAAVLDGSDAPESGDDTGDDRPRVRPVDTPPDPQDHEVDAAPGLLTRLTASKTRQAGLPAAGIATLIARVRSHAQAMKTATRN